MYISALEARKGSGQAQGEPLACSICKQRRPPTSFTNTQARKTDSARKCRECSAAADTAEAEASRRAREAKMSNAQGAAAAAAKLPKGACRNRVFASRQGLGASSLCSVPWCRLFCVVLVLTPARRRLFAHNVGFGEWDFLPKAQF